MLFNTPLFFALLGASLVVYWFARNLVTRQIALLITSVVFYAFWYPPHLILLFALVFVAYGVSRLIEVDEGQRFVWMGFGTVVVLICLAYYKYAEYFLTLAQPLIQASGKSIDPSAYRLELPLGISFITFQIIAYMVDVAKRELKPERNIFTFSLFVSFFPQLIAGPICRGHELLPQLKTKHNFIIKRFFSGMLILFAGLFLKVVFADNMAADIDRIYAAPSEFPGGVLLWASIGFGFQILSDFWGYSTMAVGMALMFGIVIPINFNLPYISTSIQSFWRRWHITLSSWLRDYLYIAVGGNRRGKLLTYRNLILTMLLGGLWHGASTNFVIWGAIHGGFLAIERLIRGLITTTFSADSAYLTVLNWAWRPIGWAITMFVTFTAWVFFRAETWDDSVSVISGIASAPMDGWLTVSSVMYVLILAFVLLMVPVHRYIEAARHEKLSTPWLLLGSSVFLFLSVVMTSPDPVPFIYFQF
ncbi:MAG: MBOAT family O-acyltransferase [Pseudomonadota bacterium]